MITMKDYLTASGSHPEREHHPEVTPEVIKNAEELLTKVNALLDKLGLTNVKVSSGFRPSDVNASLPNSAKHSLHMVGRAVDISDPDGSIDELMDESDSLLKKFGLWNEDHASTPGWCHIDDKDRGNRPKNVFKP